MLTTQVPCRGCGRFFAPRGLSQHVGKSRDPRCQNALRASRVQAASSSIQRATTPRPLSPNGGVPTPEGGRGCGGDASDAEGAFATTHDTFSGSSILRTITDDTGITGDFNAVSIEEPDPADLADADALQEMLFGTSTPSTRDQGTVDEAPADLTPQTEGGEGDQTDMLDSEAASAVVVERFSFGTPGAPIPDRHQEPSARSPEDSPWAPFRSQLDWEVARWAKLRGLTSTAVAELLAIPGVCTSGFQRRLSNLN